ncbi:PGPGW domain-containing protein [Nocardioides marmoribigeumensis]|uniref:Uncharacterized protein (TIGR02611 family) n=1 Tax=Nocardioides marmoribigeumensis TaxID=433649 RepID=A0ABU2C0Z3_9ACTN|nr:PGPGW domain-containing protein [Nocardioides marmoribigeumensis]MDR7364317.1 uncharacterized protein (TIGR02611 family) [Nocardioides marmoribigeumensis]
MERSKAVLKRVALETVGWVLVVVGIAAIPLPGPGLLCLFAGLAVLSQQYEWAEKRVRPVEKAAMKAAADSVQTWPRIVLSLLGVAWLHAIGTLWIVDPDAPGWWPVDDKWWLFGGFWTGVTLVGSGLLALGIMVYSFVKFRGQDDPRSAAGDTVGSSN